MKKFFLKTLLSVVLCVSLTLPVLPLMVIFFAVSLENVGESKIGFLESSSGEVPVYHFNKVLVLIASLNLISLIPMIPGNSLTVVLFGVVIWVTINLVSIFTDCDQWLLNFVPSGAPLLLLPLLFVIELVSYIARPGALVIRICVNLFCSHMLLVMSGFMSNMLLLVCVMLLELGVSLVQAYVYAMILML